MTIKNPAFSIITPVLNDKEGLEKTIRSIELQNLDDFEYIVIDGGSIDGTLELIKNRKIINQWVSETDKGIWDAINKGITLSKGNIISTLNAGDTYFSENSLKLVKNNFYKKDISFLFGTVKKNKVYYKYEPNKMLWSFNFYPAHSGGFFVKKEVHEKIGFYSLKYACSSDYDFFWRLIKKFKFKGSSTDKNEIISVFKLGGYSSKFSFFEHVVEETLIRINNGQNKVIVLIIFFLRCLKNFRKI